MKGNLTHLPMLAMAIFCMSALVPAQEPQVLISGLSEEHTLGPEEKHLYTVSLQEGAAVIGEADQHGVDLVIDVLGPDGKLLYTVDSPNGREGPEPIEVTAFQTGLYTLIIHTLDEKAPPGKYVMKIERVLTVDENGQRLGEKNYPPVLAALWRSYVSNSKAIEEFLASRKGKGPIIEDVKDDRENVSVTYFYYGNDHTAEVTVRGGPHAETGGLQMKRFLRTPLFFASELVPKDARYTYRFAATETQFVGPAATIQVSKELPSVRDPLNPERFEGRSALSMPSAPPQPYLLKNESIPQGKLTPAALNSAVLKENRNMTIYTPAGYEGTKKPSDLLILFDGEDYDGGDSSSVSVPTILDNLIAAKKIPPAVAVFVKNNAGHRLQDLVESRQFADFIGTELVPWVRKNYGINPGANHVVIAGASAGGLAASYCAFTHSEVIGNALSLSGPYWVTKGWRLDVPFPLAMARETGDLIGQFRTSKPLPLRFYVAVGRFEFTSAMLGTNRELRDVLLLKGYPVTYEEVDGAHDSIWWRGSLADGLISLLEPRTN